MANNQNLRPGAHPLTVEEQSRGGKRSGKVRQQKQRLRKAIQEALDGKYTIKDSNGEPVTLNGEQLIAKKILEVIADTNNKNWFDVLQLLLTLTDSDITETALAIREVSESSRLKNLTTPVLTDWTL